jgi:hypothetical protein
MDVVVCVERASREHLDGIALTAPDGRKSVNTNDRKSVNTNDRALQLAGAAEVARKGDVR